MKSRCERPLGSAPSRSWSWTLRIEPPAHRRAPPPRVGGIALLLLFCAAFFSPVFAAEILLKPDVGFGGLFHLGHPFPLRVDLTNRGRPVEGTLEVRVWKGGPAKGTDPYPWDYRRELFLPAEGRKSVLFTVEPDSLSRPLTLRFFSREGSVAESVDLRRHFSPTPLTLVVTGRAVPPSIRLAPGLTSPLIAVSLAELPAQARAYRGVWAVIFYEQSLRDLASGQADALEAWLASGGTILILGSPHYALYQEAAMSRFLPVKVVGVKKLSSLSSLEKVYGKAKLSSREGVTVPDSRTIEGRVIFEQQGTPILVEALRGRGKVAYLALDPGRPPVLGWEAFPLVLRDVLGSPPRGDMNAQAGVDEATVFSQLLGDRGFFPLYVPGLAFLLWVALYLVGAGVAGWRWRYRHGSPRALAAAVFLWAVASAAGGYFHLAWGDSPTDGVLVSSTWLETLPNGYAESDSNVALFSLHRRDYELQVPAGWMGFEAVPSAQRKGEENAQVVHNDGLSDRLRFAVREWTHTLFRIRSITRFPLSVEVEQRDPRLILKIANQSPYDLAECWFVRGGEPTFLGRVPARSVQQKELTPDPRAGTEGQTQARRLGDITFQDKRREMLFRASVLHGGSDRVPWPGGSSVILGWVEGLGPVVSVQDAKLAAHHYVLFWVEVPSIEEAES